MSVVWLREVLRIHIYKKKCTILSENLCSEITIIQNTCANEYTHNVEFKYSFQSINIIRF